MAETNFLTSSQKYNQTTVSTTIIYMYLSVSIFSIMCLSWSYQPLIALNLPYVPYSPYTGILLLRLHLCARLQSNRTIIHGDIAFQRIGDTESVATNAVWVLIQSLTIFLCSFKFFTSVSHFKTIGLLLMEILHFRYLGDTQCHLAMTQCHLDIYQTHPINQTTLRSFEHKAISPKS